MLAAGSMMYGYVTPMPGRMGWRHMFWGRGMMGHWGMGWPWLGLIAGAIVLVSAILLYSAPRYARSLGLTIVVTSALNILFGVGGILASLLALSGGLIAITPEQHSPQA